MSISAIKQALEALRNAEVVYMEQLNAMYALQQVIAEAEKQEPVAFRNIETGEFCTGGFLRKDWAKWQPLYAAPVQASDEFKEMVEKGTKAWADTPDDWVDELRGGAEPVGYVSESGKGAYLLVGVGLEDDTPLYAAPPKREWVGLTDHELQVLDFNDPERGKLARAVEAKLKEKNT
jgi:hypothetical protein